MFWGSVFAALAWAYDPGRVQARVADYVRSEPHLLVNKKHSRVQARVADYVRSEPHLLVNKKHSRVQARVADYVRSEPTKSAARAMSLASHQVFISSAMRRDAPGSMKLAVPT
jgi:hypothetical protein